MADVTHTIDPDSGAGYDYTSLNAWQTAIDAAYGSGDNLTAECLSSGGSADTAVVTFGGEGLDSINITQTDFPTDGVYDATAYRLAGGDMFKTNGNLVMNIDGLQFDFTSTTYGDAALQIGTYGDVLVLDFNRLIIKGNVSGSNSFNGIWIVQTSNSGSEITIKNTTVSGITGISGRGIYLQNFGGEPTEYIYNCVIEGCTEGIRVNDVGSGVTIKNCVVFNNTDDFAGTQLGSATIDYIASDDDDSWTHWVDLNENASGEWAANFTDYSNGDFSVKDASAGIYHAGVNVGLSTDIIGTNWNDPPSIGAFEYMAAGGGESVEGALSFSGVVSQQMAYKRAVGGSI